MHCTAGRITLRISLKKECRGRGLGMTWSRHVEDCGTAVAVGRTLALSSVSVDESAPLALPPKIGQQTHAICEM